MFIVNVIPITKGILKEKLTYFSLKDVQPGSLVEIPLRKKIVKALVTDRKNASESKSSLRQADFTIKKISSLKVKNFLLPEFIESAVEIGNFFVSKTGVILNNVIPKTILENVQESKIKTSSKFSKDSHEKLLIQASDEERFSVYKRLIREEFAKNFSVLFIVPTLEDVKNAKEILEKGIENYTFSLRNDLKKKELLDVWNNVLKEEHPLLIITTPQFMCLPRKDFNVIILERENSSAYKQLTRPYLDMRTFAEIFSKKIGTKLLLGDTLLRTETIWREKNLEFADITPLKFRSISNTTQTLAIIKREKGSEFSPISEELIELLKVSLKNKESLFIFGLRKGLFPMIQCGDCGESVKCPNCSSPSVVHQDSKGRFLLCHKCGLKREVPIKCDNCKGWRLNPLGVSLGTIEEAIKAVFPEILIFRVDKESTKTPRQAREEISKFLKNPGSVLIGTEMALSYLKSVDNVACAAVDSLFSIPDFRINEKVFSLLLRLRALSKNNFLIQTKNQNSEFWQNILEGNLMEFYKGEIEQRELLNYPPFSILIKITVQGLKKSVEKEVEKLTELFAENNPQAYPGFISKIKGRHIMNVLLKMPRESWPNQDLVNKLASLSPKFIVKVDPENIL